MNHSSQASAAGSARAAFLARIREIAEEYHKGTRATACMAEVFAALREYDRRRPQAQPQSQPHQQPKRRPQP